MRRCAIFGLLALMAGLLTAAPAAACIGQMVVSPAVVVPGGEIKVRGFGFWADPRPVTLVWENGPVIAVVQPDPEGNFELTLRAPAAEGTFRIVATQGELDPAPFAVTLTVTAAPAQGAVPPPTPESVALPGAPQVTGWPIPAALAAGAALAALGLWARRAVGLTRHAG